METTDKKELKVTGMTCSGCARTVTHFLEKRGLKDIYVDFASDEVSFRYTPGTDIPGIINGINSLGYHASEMSHDHSHGHDHSHAPGRSLEWRFAIAAIFSAPLLLHMAVSWPWLHNPYVQLVLSLPPMVIGFMHFGKSAWGSLRSGAANMDVLIFIGAFSAFFYSLYGTFFRGEHAGHYLFYETGATIITFVLLGNLLEHRSIKRTTSAIEELSKIKPAKARKVVHDLVSGTHQYLEVDAAGLRKGDILQVNAGEAIPVDGLVTEGAGDVDESMITGESVPEEKAVGNEVKAGTVLVNGSIRFKASRVGNDTTLAQVINWVKMAQAERSPIQQLCDRISNVFVPLVVGIALLTLAVNFWWVDTGFEEAMMRAVAVLVIACPCALGLATPTATVVGLGKAARHGILIKGAGTVEQLSGIKNLVLDKTGTLTTGDFLVKDLIAAENETEAKNVIYSMEAVSSHPIGKSIRKNYADWESAPVRWISLEEIRGLGIKAVSEDGNEYVLGNARALGKNGDRDIYLLRDGSELASFNITDELKPGINELVSRFRGAGVEIILLSGDNEKKTGQVADQLGISQWYAAHTPDMKLEKIKELSAAGYTAMAGDGINDAPALTLANVGIAVSNASNIAQQSARVVIMNSSVDALWEAYAAARLTYRTIKQNLFWAFFYNIIAIPVAAAGYLSPIFGALVMAFSDVVIIGNSLLLRFRKYKP